MVKRHAPGVIFLHNGKGRTMIEWANLIEEILPEHFWQIVIEKDLEKGFDYRMITVEEVGKA